MAGEIRRAFAKRKIEVAHLKISLEEESAGAASAINHRRSTIHPPRLAAIQWVRTGSDPEFTQRLAGPVAGGRLLLNLRAEAEPEFLSQAVKGALAAARRKAAVTEVNYAAFKPSPPKPTHRLTEPARNGHSKRSTVGTSARSSRPAAPVRSGKKGVAGKNVRAPKPAARAKLGETKRRAGAARANSNSLSR